MTYREEVQKVYQKIDELAKGGDLSLQDYYLYVDELVNQGKFALLEDVMVTKYKIDPRKFKTVEDFKKGTFKDIKFKTTPDYQKSFRDLLTTKSVYNIGAHYYSSTNNKYLGDIVEVEPQWADNSHLINNSPWQNPIVHLNVVKGLSSSISRAIPRFGDISSKTFQYITQSQVLYEGSIFECVNSFTWSKGDVITPTYSQYFTQSTFPNYYLIEISDKNKSLLSKYSLGIDILKL